MIVSFKVKNFLSFKDKVEFTTIAGKERKNSQTLSNLKKYRMKILPLTAIYGANASGKSNFIKSLFFLQTLIVKGIPFNSPIPVRPFLFSDSIEENSFFELTFLAEETLYTYSIELNPKVICYESLRYFNSRSEYLLYERKIGEKVLIPQKTTSSKELKIIAERVPNNTPLLTSFFQMRFEDFRAPFKWFDEQLQIIFPTSFFIRYDKLLKHDEQRRIGTQLLCDIGIGLSGLDVEPIDNLEMRLSDTDKSTLRTAIEKSGPVLLRQGPFGDGRIIVSLKNGDLKFEKVVSVHKDSSGVTRYLPLEEESDGTKRFIDLMPSILDLTGGKEHSVYIIDEIDRSLHTDLTRNMVEKFLENCGPNNRGQLIFSTHDTNLLRRTSIRKDEIWFIDNVAGSSFLSRCSDYEAIRIDSSLQKLYEEGRFGAVPVIS